MRSKISNHEGQAIAFLGQLADAQELFRQGCLVDQDNDGQGEHGLLQELSGALITRGGTAAVAPPFIGRLESASDNRIFKHHGYYFMLYLPTQTGVLPQNGTMTSQKENANAQELRYVIYAWPAAHGSGGNRAFAVNPQGVVYASANVKQSYVGLKNIPLPEAAMDTSKGATATHETPLGGKVCGDGQTWSECQ